MESKGPSFYVEVCIAIWAVGRARHNLIGTNILIEMLNMAFAQCYIDDWDGVLRYSTYGARKVEAAETCIGLYSNINPCGFQNGNRACFVGSITRADAIIIWESTGPSFHVEVCIAIWAVGRARHGLIGTNSLIELKKMAFAQCHIDDWDGVLSCGLCKLNRRTRSWCEIIVGGGVETYIQHRQFCIQSG